MLGLQMSCFRHTGVPRILPTASQKRQKPSGSKACRQGARRLQRCPAVAQAPQQINRTTARPETIQLELATLDLRAAIRLGEAKAGDARAIILAEVAPGSPAEQALVCVQAGVMPRQRVFAISDPVRRGEMLELNDRPSLRFVRDALQMQRGEQMELVLSKEPLAQEEEPQEAWAPPAKSESASEGMTIAQKLQKQQEEAAVTLTAVERRRRKRQEYMNTSSGRDNRLFWFVVLATFVLPVVVILGVAFQSGYLDRLAGGYNSR